MQRDEVTTALTARRGTAEDESGALVVAARTVSTEDVEREQKIGWMLLILVAALLAAEMVLADRIVTRE